MYYVPDSRPATRDPHSVPPYCISSPPRGLEAVGRYPGSITPISGTVAGQVPGLFPADVAPPAQASYPPSSSGARSTRINRPHGMGILGRKPREPLKHSGLGMRLFILSVAVGVLIMALFVVRGNQCQNSRRGGIDEKIVRAIISGLCPDRNVFCPISWRLAGIARIGAARPKKDLRGSGNDLFKR